ncbi:Ankyrin repeat domain-containing protein 13D [Chlorella vulgaris]
MKRLKHEITVLSHNLNEEFFEALSSTPTATEGQARPGEGSQPCELALHRQGRGLTSLRPGTLAVDCVLQPAAPGPSCCRAAYNGDVDALRRLLPSMSLLQKLQFDPQGNTASEGHAQTMQHATLFAYGSSRHAPTRHPLQALHVAVIRRQYEAIRLLLEAGLPPDAKNARRWNSLDEAVALNDAEASKLLYTRLLADAKRAKREKKAQLVAVMRQLPDFSMELHWELGSPLFGLLLRCYAPDDTYHMYKLGDRLRVDGTLMGLEEHRHSLIPHYKRGRFSLLVNAGVSPTAAFLVDHCTQSYFDLYHERKAHLKGVDREVAEMLAEGASKVRVADADFEFKPVKNWRGRQVTEKVDGWQTEVYEASGFLSASTWLKVPVQLPPATSFDQYLQLQLPPDEVAEIASDPLAMSQKEQHRESRWQGDAKPGTGTSACTSASSSTSGGRQGATKAQRFSSRCWLAHGYPVSLAQMIPLLEVVAAGNKHFAQAAAFLRRFPSHTYFPTRVQVPLLWTVYLQLGFRRFTLLGADPADQPALLPDFYEGIDWTASKTGICCSRTPHRCWNGSTAAAHLKALDSKLTVTCGASLTNRQRAPPLALAIQGLVLAAGGCMNASSGALGAPRSSEIGASPELNALCGDLLDLTRLQQPPQPCHGPAIDLGSPASQPLGFTAADLLRSHQQSPLAGPRDALQQLAALQQQQQLAEALSAEPLLCLGNLMAAQGLQDLLALNQQLQQTAPVRLSTGGIRGTGPVNNALYKFAHGREELRPVVRHPKYKTEVCRTFAQSGTCPYGTRCRFIHTTTPITPAPSACIVADAPLSSLVSPTKLISSTTSALPAYGTPPIPTVSNAAVDLGADSAATALSACLAGLQCSTAVNPPCSFPGLATFPAAAASPAAYAGCGAARAYSPAAASTCGADASPASMLATLSALLGRTAPAPSPPPFELGADSFTATHRCAAAAAPSPLSVVAPAGLPAIGVGHCLPSTEQQQPICPGTPVASAGAGVRRSISDCDASTPGSSMKRLPIFERLIPEDGCVATATALGTPAGQLHDL